MVDMRPSRLLKDDTLLKQACLVEAKIFITDLLETDSTET